MSAAALFLPLSLGAPNAPAWASRLVCFTVRLVALHAYTGLRCRPSACKLDRCRSKFSCRWRHSSGGSSPARWRQRALGERFLVERDTLRSQRSSQTPPHLRPRQPLSSKQVAPTGPVAHPARVQGTSETPAAAAVLSCRPARLRKHRRTPPSPSSPAAHPLRRLYPPCRPWRPAAALRTA